MVYIGIYHNISAYMSLVAASLPVSQDLKSPASRGSVPDVGRMTTLGWGGHGSEDVPLAWMRLAT